MSEPTLVTCPHCGKVTPWYEATAHCTSCKRFTPETEHLLQDVLPRRPCAECGGTAFLFWELKEAPLYCVTCRACGLTTFRARPADLKEAHPVDVVPRAPYR